VHHPRFRDEIAGGRAIPAATEAGATKYHLRFAHVLITHSFHRKHLMLTRSFFNRSLFAGVVLGGAAALLVGYGPALAQATGLKPAVVATVNLSSVMEKLDQRAEATANMTALSQVVRAEDTKRKDEITKLQERLEALRKELADKAPTPEAAALQEELALKTLQYQAWSRFTLDKVDIEKALLLQDLYRSIKAAAHQMATANGYDLVLVDDSQGEITTSAETRVSREAQVMNQIIARRMLFSNPTHDITDALITRMNNAHKAAGSTPKQ
jgi:Skp family chaperone for outer membrane proteins